MLSYIEYLNNYLNIPSKVILSLVALFLLLQIIGEILEFKGKVVPEFIKIRKFFIRKKQERETVKEMADTLKEVRETHKEMQAFLADVRQHYSEDNIAMRDGWMRSVDEGLAESKAHWYELNQKIDKNNEDTRSLLIDSKRNEIINFANKVIDEKSPVTREQFNRIFKIHHEYEEIIKNNNLKNGEVDISFRIINESYEAHMRNHTFIEDVRGY